MRAIRDGAGPTNRGVSHYGAYLLPNPMKIGDLRAFAHIKSPTGVLKVVRHPAMWGITLWAISHTCVIGELASLVFFSGLLVLALEGAWHIDQRRRSQFPAHFARFVAVTSFLPMGAIMTGRSGFGVEDIYWTPLTLVLSGYVLLIVVHEFLSGVSPWPV